MRILANYSFRNNGDSYQVTFETSGDVPKEQADSAVDELFNMAKRAIQRQVNPSGNQEVPHKEDVVIPELKKTNGDSNGNGKHQIKDPAAPISAKQKSFIIKLAKERGQFVENLNDMKMEDASRVIEQLLAVGA